MKKLVFTVTVQVSDKIYADNEIKEMAENIAIGLVDQANTAGLTPEESEAYTETITVTNDVANVTIEKYML